MFEKLSENLKSLGYQVSCFENREAAADYLKESLHGVSIGIGGSVTVQQLDVTKSLRENNTVYWHWEPLPGTTAEDMLEKAVTSDVYISSVNGMAETGEIINIDGKCNRISAILYGHQKIYLIAGKNKIAPTFDEAMFRARNVAAPLNAKRLNKRTPCAEKADRCHNCKSPDRICNGLSVLWRRPGGTKTEVILINEDLGY